MFKTSKEHVFPINNILYNEQVLWMLNVLHGTIHANKEPLSLRVRESLASAT